MSSALGRPLVTYRERTGFGKCPAAGSSNATVPGGYPADTRRYPEDNRRHTRRILGMYRLPSCAQGASASRGLPSLLIENGGPCIAGKRRTKRCGFHFWKTACHQRLRRGQCVFSNPSNCASEKKKKSAFPPAAFSRFLLLLLLEKHKVHPKSDCTLGRAAVRVHSCRQLDLEAQPNILCFTASVALAKL